MNIKTIMLDIALSDSFELAGLALLTLAAVYASRAGLGRHNRWIVPYMAYHVIRLLQETTNIALRLAQPGMILPFWFLRLDRLVGMLSSLIWLFAMVMLCMIMHGEVQRRYQTKDGQHQEGAWPPPIGPEN